MKEVKKIKIGDVCDVMKGSTGIMKAVPGKYPMVTLATERASHKEYQFDCKAVIVQLVSSTGHGHASMKRVHYQEGKFALGSILAAIIPRDEKYLHPKYLHIYLSYFKDELLVSLMRGAANVSLSISSIKTVEIIIPAYCKQLEIIKLEKILSRQNKALGVELGEQKIIIQKLRQAILQDAIEGKLTADWRKKNPDVEPASELLKKIKAEKEKLIAEKKIKKEKPLPEISEEEIPFELPKEWEWTRLGEIGQALIGLTYRPDQINETGTSVLRSNNIIENKLDYNNLIKVKGEIPKSKIAEIGDILICARNGSKRLIGKAAIIEKEDMAFGAFMSLFKSKFNKYVFYFLLSNVFRAQIDDEKSTGINQLTQGILLNTIFPFPPPPEQKAIVKKVETLMQELDKLELEISKNQKTADMLMQAVLKEAFEK